MGKALLMASTAATLASGDECNLFGYGSDTTTESAAQASCTEAATFSNLRANVISGGSGTNNFQFRDAGANGNQLASIAGTGVIEDAVNTDVLSAADLFNIAYTDTGTASTISWIAGNIEFSSGHGNFHVGAAYGGVVCDAASATRFLPLMGSLGADGTLSEDGVEWTVRGYDSFEALQVRVTANARSNNSIFKNRINAGDGGGSITFATTETGLKTVTGLGDAITDGQTINSSITLGTGVEDLTVSFVGGTFKSSTNKSETFTFFRLNGLARTASATAHYVPIGGDFSVLTAYTEAQARIKVGFAAVVSNLRCYLSANTYTGNGTLKLYQNGSAVLTTTITASGGAGWYENTSDTITIDDNDELSFEFDEGTGGSITIHSAGITFSPVSGTTDGALEVDTTATLTGTGAATAAVPVSIAAVGTLTGVGAATAASTFSITSAGAFTGFGVGLYPSEFSIDAASTFTAEASSTASVELSVGATSLVTFDAAATASTALLVTAQALLTLETAATAAVPFSMAATATLTGEGAATASAELSALAAATVTWVGETVAEAQSAFNISTAATFTGAASSTAASEISIVGTATFIGTGAATATTEANLAAAATFTGRGAATGAGEVSISGAATFIGETEADAASEVSISSVGNFIGVSAATAASAVAISSAATFSPTAEATGAAAVAIAAAATVTFDAEDASGGVTAAEILIEAASEFLPVTASIAAAEASIAATSSATFVTVTTGAVVDDDMIIRLRRWMPWITAAEEERRQREIAEDDAEVLEIIKQMAPYALEIRRRNRMRTLH
jgi:hypothetical protein